MVFKNFLSKDRPINVQSYLPDATILVDNTGNILWSNDIAKDFFAEEELINNSIDNYLENGFNSIISSSNTGSLVTTKIISSDENVDLMVRRMENEFVTTIRRSHEIVVEPEEEKIEYDTNKNSFLIDIAADLKSPLQSIVGFSQAIIDGLGGTLNGKQEKYLKVINNNSADLLYFFEKLTDLLKTESNLFEKNIRYFDVINLINNIVKTNKQLYSEKTVLINSFVEEDTNKTINSDETIFKMMLNTLLETIIRDSDIGNVNINVSNASEEFLDSHNLKNTSALLVSISSSSFTVLESELPTLFEPYAVIHKGNKKATQNAIALASVRNLVKYLRGIVWAELVPLKGTVFHIILPFEKEINE